MLRFPFIIFISFNLFSFIPIVVSEEPPDACLKPEDLKIEINLNDVGVHTYVYFCSTFVNYLIYLSLYFLSLIQRRGMNYTELTTVIV